MPPSIIDSHVHFWPARSSNPAGHTWMTPNHVLAHPHLPETYLEAVRQSRSGARVGGFIFVETDARLETPSADLVAWTRGPLDEVDFLRETFVVDGRVESLLAGVVLWAPISRPTNVLEEWLGLVEERAGRELWARVKGFRFLLQGIRDRGEFKGLVLGETFIRNLRLLGERGFTFDVGIDQRSGGTWQLELMARAMKMVQDGVAEEQRTGFVLNHLCKPEFEYPSCAFDDWCAVMEEFSTCSKTYVKLSGAFNEVPPSLTTAREVAKHITPWVKHLIKCFGPERILFGSDWPVCNIRGAEKGATWAAWEEVVAIILDDVNGGLSPASRERIWRGTAIEAYRLEQLLSHIDDNKTP